MIQRTELHPTMLIITPHDRPAPTQLIASSHTFPLKAPTKRPWLGSFVCETPWLDELGGLPLSMGDT